MPSTVICQRCHEINEPNATVCQKCGARFCPHCHLLIESPDTSICTHCGKKDLSFRPGKYSAGSVASSTVAPGAMPASRYVCPSCGNRIDPSLGKCPYCGQLGNRFTVMPTQGHGVMKPAQGDQVHTFTAPPPGDEGPNTQKVCSKCGRVIPPGSSLCPVHGKFGGGNTMRNIAPAVKDKTFEGEVYRRMEERKDGPVGQARSNVRQTAPEEIYPQMTSAPAMPDASPAAADQRTCPSCGYAVPDRSKVCPTCGCNRLPPEKRKAFIKAEDRYKAVEAAQQAYAAYPPQANQYYGQPAAQPYEMAYPAPAPGFVQEIYPEKKRGKEKKPREREERLAKPGQKASPLPILLALVALAGVIVIGIVFLLDQLKTPAPAVMPPSTVVTPSGSTKGPAISNIQYSNITRTGATVTWKTDKKSNSIVIYCIDGGDLCENARDDALVTDHSVNLTNLEQGKGYHITVKSSLGDSPDAPDSSLEATAVLRTSELRDTTPPVVTNVKPANLMGSSATITWNTDEPATSQVAYGTTATYGTFQPTQTDTTLVKYHEVFLQGLPPQSTFHYKIISRDADGNESSSSDKTFTTAAPEGSLIGNSAPDFTLNCANQNDPVTLSSYLGKKIVINFWSLGCDPCIKEMPLLQQFHENNPDVPLIVIAGPQVGQVNGPAIGTTLSDSNYTFIVPLDASGLVGSQYDIKYVPTTFFIDSSGIIRDKQEGSFSNVATIESRLRSY